MGTCAGTILLAIALAALLFFNACGANLRFNSSDDRVVRASASGAVDLGLYDALIAFSR